MTNKYYGVYFDKNDLMVDEDGQLMNPEALYIIEFVYDEKISDEPIEINRIDPNGNVIEEYPDLSDKDYVGYDDEPTVEKAMFWFDKWLEDNLEWEEYLPETRWQPAEYICVGISERS